ncbi:MAG: HEPN domain-containing protein [Methylococcaceae bacterium]|nr:HEPN domain-containing protein [Methylococcaceae bacterium]
MNKTELENLADIRIKEAKVLLEAECYHGAYYLAGYALECTLKACIAKQVKEFDFPSKKLAQDSYTHNLTKLLATSDLNQKLTEEENRNLEFKLNWSIVKHWSEEARYDCAITKIKAEELFDAITSNESGILQWLKNFL